MDLRYTGPTMSDLPLGSALPLPEGWQAADHDEPDADLAAEKVKSGLYAAAGKPKRGQDNEASAGDGASE